MNAPVHGSCNDIIGGSVRPRRLEISLFSYGSIFCHAVHSFAETFCPSAITRTFIAGGNDTTKKLFTVVNDIADKFFSAVAITDTCEKTVLPISA
jgi:hypothetical protein